MNANALELVLAERTRLRMAGWEPTKIAVSPEFKSELAWATAAHKGVITPVDLPRLYGMEIEIDESRPAGEFQLKDPARL